MGGRFSLLGRLMAWHRAGAASHRSARAFTTTQGETTYTGSHFTITCTDRGDGDGFYLSGSDNATITARNGEIITRVEFTKGYFDISRLSCAVGTTTISGDVATVSGVNATNGTDDTTDDKTATCTITVTDPDQEAADAVVALFDALPAVADITVDSKAAIEAARAAYEALTADQKALIAPEDLAKLTIAEEALHALIIEGIEDVQGEKVQSTKILRSGHIYIIRPEGKVYNAQGVRVK